MKQSSINPFKPVSGFAEKSFFGGKELKGKIETNHK